MDNLWTVDICRKSSQQKLQWRCQALGSSVAANLCQMKTERHRWKCGQTSFRMASRCATACALASTVETVGSSPATAQVVLPARWHHFASGQIMFKSSQIHKAGNHTGMGRKKAATRLQRSFSSPTLARGTSRLRRTAS